MGSHFDDFIKSGRYKSASEVIRSGLLYLEDEKRKIASINEALVVGESSGEPVEFNNDTFKQNMKKKLDHES